MSSRTAEHAYQPLLDGLSLDKRLAEMQRWRKRSRLIHLARWLLPAVMIAGLAVLSGWAAVKALASLNGARDASALAIRMVKPQFLGRTQQDKPFFLAADTAVRDNGQSQLIYLERPVVVVGDQPRDQTKVTADKGVYRENTRILILDGHVHMTDGAGNDFLSPHAVVDTLTNDVDGPAHVDGHGPLGRISSDSYAVRNGGERVLFTGKVSAHIEQHPAAAPAAKVNLRGPR